ncbi:hypothetical protein N9K77_01080 [bacterium]|nr:hypothetical protein [bacterium]
MGHLILIKHDNNGCKDSITNVIVPGGANQARFYKREMQPF